MTMDTESLLNMLICPDCKGKIVFENLGYRCSNCKRSFPVRSGVIIMLPSYLEDKKSNEDIYYKEHRMDGEGKPAWMSLVHKRDDIERFINVILPKYKHEIKGRMLDIGSGTCWASSIISLFSESPLEIIATDVSPTALQKGVKVTKVVGSNIDYYIAGDAERLPFDDGCFDVVFCYAAIHHFLNVDRGLREIYRVLKRGGICIGVETVNNNILKLIYKSRFGIAGERARRRGITENEYSYTEWINLFRQAGFEEVNINLERTLEYKSSDIILYYRLISPLPDFFVKRFLASSMSIVAKKGTSGGNNR